MKKFLTLFLLAASVAFGQGNPTLIYTENDNLRLTPTNRHVGKVTIGLSDDVTLNLIQVTNAITFADSTSISNGLLKTSTGATSVDWDSRTLHGDWTVSSNLNVLGTLTVVDITNTVLYLTNLYAASATIGDLTVTNSANFSCVINAGGYQITNVANGTIASAAVNLSQLQGATQGVWVVSQYPDALLIDGSRAMTGILNAGNQQITNVANGTVASAAVNLSQLQAATNGLVPSGIAYLANNQVFTATNNFSGPVIVGTNAPAIAGNRGITLVGSTSEAMLEFRRTSDGISLGNMGLGTLKMYLKSTGAGVDLELNGYDDVNIVTGNGNQCAVFNSAGNLFLSNNLSLSAGKYISLNDGSATNCSLQWLGGTNGIFASADGAMFFIHKGFTNAYLTAGGGFYIDQARPISASSAMGTASARWGQFGAAVATISNLTIDGNINMSGKAITNLVAGTAALDAVNLSQLQGATGGVWVISQYPNALLLDGTRAMTGALNMGSERITNLANGVSAQDAVAMSQLIAATNALATSGILEISDAIYASNANMYVSNSYFLGTVSIPGNSASVGDVWTCTNATTGGGEWQPGGSSGMDTNDSFWLAMTMPNSTSMNVVFDAVETNDVTPAIAAGTVAKVQKITLLNTNLTGVTFSALIRDGTLSVTNYLARDYTLGPASMASFENLGVEANGVIRVIGTNGLFVSTDYDVERTNVWNCRSLPLEASAYTNLLHVSPVAAGTRVRTLGGYFFNTNTAGTTLTAIRVDGSGTTNWIYKDFTLGARSSLPIAPMFIGEGGGVYAFGENVHATTLYEVR